MLVFIGTQDSAIHAARLDPASRSLTGLGPVANVPRPTFVLADPRRPVLYAVSEIGNAGDAIGHVLSFSIDAATATLREQSRQPSGGGGPTHLTLDEAGTTLFAANFGGGEVACFPVGADGTLAPASAVHINQGSGPHRRQKNAHAHGVTLDPTQNWLLVPDMGADRVFVHRFDAATHSLAPAQTPAIATPPGSGPRLLLFSPDGNFAHLLTELSAEIVSYRWVAATGTLVQSGVTRLDAGPQPAPNAAALCRAGNSLYASNRATNSIEHYQLTPGSAGLTHRQSIPSGGEKPWSAHCTPDATCLAVTNQGSNLVQLFHRHPQDGTLTACGAPLTIPTPTSLAFI